MSEKPDIFKWEEEPTRPDWNESVCMQKEIVMPKELEESIRKDWSAYIDKHDELSLPDEICDFVENYADNGPIGCLDDFMHCHECFWSFFRANQIAHQSVRALEATLLVYFSKYAPDYYKFGSYLCAIWGHTTIIWFLKAIRETDCKNIFSDIYPDKKWAKIKDGKIFVGDVRLDLHNFNQNTIQELEYMIEPLGLWKPEMQSVLIGQAISRLISIQREYIKLKNDKSPF